jgi:hypothetical protein
MTRCPVQMLPWGRTYAVVVSGARLNPYGHMLLNTGGPGGTYFQVSEVYGQPRFLVMGWGTSTSSPTPTPAAITYTATVNAQSTATPSSKKSP